MPISFTLIFDYTHFKEAEKEIGEIFKEVPNVISGDTLNLSDHLYGAPDRFVQFYNLMPKAQALKFGDTVFSKFPPERHRTFWQRFMYLFRGY